jgi:hypothetical protein
MKDNFFTQLQFIRQVVSGSQNPEDAMTTILPILKTDDDLLREFFNELQTADWLDVLQADGFFDSAPGIQKLPSGSYRYIPWPASKYLLRVAPSAPGKVVDILKNIQTDNATVVNDILDIANIVEPNHALHLLPTLSDALESETFWISSKDTARLCVRLLNEGFSDAALQFANSLYSPSTELEPKRHYRTDRHWYSEGLRTITPVFSVLSSKEYLLQLCNWLTNAINAKEFDVQEDGYDISDSWRPAIETHEQNHDWDLASIFVDFLRDGFENAIESKSIEITEALSILDRYNYTIFRRIRLHLINRFAELVPDLAKDTMLDQDNFKSSRTKHEYAMLMGNRYTMLTQSERAQWLEFVSEGPDLTAYDSYIENQRGESPTDEGRNAHSVYWKFQRYHWIRDHLEGSNRKFYDEMDTKHGQPRLADMSSYMTVGDVRDASPMTVEELQAVPFSEAVEKISTWKPDSPETWESPTYQGLNRTFINLLSHDRARYSSHADDMIGRHPLFIRSFLMQMTAAVKDQIGIDLDTVYKLCEWILTSPDTTMPVAKLESGALIDSDWRWVRLEICDLIREICKVSSGSETIYHEISHRKPLSNLLQLLFTDPIDDPVDLNRNQPDPRLYDYTTYALNSQQGHAMRALVEYARWIANQHKTSANGNDVVTDGIGLMPEVKDLIDFALADENQSISYAAILGESIGILYWIDSDWLESIIDKMIVLDRIPADPLYEMGWASWNSFICWVNPHRVYYELLADKYKTALEQSFTLKAVEKTSSLQPMFRLTEHLMILYGRGDLTDEKDVSLVDKMVTNSPIEMRINAIGFVGKSISNNDPLPQKVTERFKSLWTKYWKTNGKQDANTNHEDHLFGRWFASGQFDEAWALNQLVEYSDIVGIPEPDHAVAERMEAIVHVDTHACLTVLKNMVEGDHEGWHIHSWIKPAFAILKHGMECDEDTRILAEEIINKLGRLGHLDFGKLLSQN